MDPFRAFLSKIMTFFSILKRAGQAFSVPRSCASLRVAEYPSYPWICLNIVGNAWINCSDYDQGSEYAWSSYMFDRLWKMPQPLNKTWFWIWYICIYKYYSECQICLIRASYASIMPEYTSICVNVPQYYSTPLNILEYPWRCLKMPE